MDDWSIPAHDRRGRIEADGWPSVGFCCHSSGSVAIRRVRISISNMSTKTGGADGRQRRKWFHVTFSTYGTWLPGDPRGYRTWRHREHVEGDYRTPPKPDIHARTLLRSRQYMKRAAVRLNGDQRRCAGEALLEMLLRQDAQVVALAVGAEHVHVVAKLPDANARLVVGRAKKHAAHILRGIGWVGGAWAKRCRTLPIRDRAHQLNAIEYVKRHRGEGAWAWTWGEPLPIRNENGASA